MSNEHDRWCPTCGIWVPDSKQRIRGDGLRRHAECDTITSPTKTTAGEHVAIDPEGGGKNAQKCTCDKGWDHFTKPSELQELAARMAADEANEGNYAAAAELQEQVKELQAQIEDRDAAERIRRFVERSLDRLKPQLVRRIAAVIEPEDGAEAAAERLVEKGLRFVPTSKEMEATERELGFIIAGPSTPTRLHEDGSRKLEVDWNDVVYQRLDESAAAELRACREAGYEDWGLFALMRVPDELVFGTEQPEEPVAHDSGCAFFRNPKLCTCPAEQPEADRG